MRADFKLLLEACVLANQSVCDVFLRLAETPRLYVPQLSAEILAEVRTTHVEKLGWPIAIADSWQSAVEQHFPESMVIGYERFVALAENDAKDRYVLAAAIRSQAEVIVTFNLRHFPTAALEPWKIVAVHPADYLITLYGIDSGVVVAKLEAIARKLGRTPEAVLAQLRRSVPAFSFHVADALGWELPDP